MCNGSTRKRKKSLVSAEIKVKVFPKFVEIYTLTDLGSSVKSRQNKWKTNHHKIHHKLLKRRKEKVVGDKTLKGWDRVSL